VKFRSTLLGEASGSIGGATASRNKGGQYFRARSNPTNPATMWQVTTRQSFAQAVAEWANLSSGQREAWDYYAAETPWIGAFGSTIRLSGQQAFLRAMSLIKLGAAWGIGELGSLDTVDLRNGPGENTLGPTPDTDVMFTWLMGPPATWTIEAVFGDAGPAGTVYALFMSGPVNPAKKYFKGPYVLVGASIQNAGSSSFPVSDTDETPWNQKFTQPNNGSWYHGYARSITPDGRVSTRQLFGPVLAVEI
jgi:hypothetical protein